MAKFKAKKYLLRLASWNN